MFLLLLGGLHLCSFILVAFHLLGILLMAPFRSYFLKQSWNTWCWQSSGQPVWNRTPSHTLSLNDCVWCCWLRWGCRSLSSVPARSGGDGFAFGILGGSAIPEVQFWEEAIKCVVTSSKNAYSPNVSFLSQTHITYRIQQISSAAGPHSVVFPSLTCFSQKHLISMQSLAKLQ